MQMRIDFDKDDLYLSSEMHKLFDKYFSKTFLGKLLYIEIKSYLDLDCNCGESHIEIYGDLYQRYSTTDTFQKGKIPNVKLSFSIDYEIKKDCDNIECMFVVAKHFKEIITLSVNNVKHTKRKFKKHVLNKEGKFVIENEDDDETYDSVTVSQSSPITSDSI